MAERDRWPLWLAVALEKRRAIQRAGIKDGSCIWTKS
jgi:hypothetical protein